MCGWLRGWRGCGVSGGRSTDFADFHRWSCEHEFSPPLGCERLARVAVEGGDYTVRFVLGKGKSCYFVRFWAMGRFKWDGDGKAGILDGKGGKENLAVSVNLGASAGLHSMYASVFWETPRCCE